MDLVCIFDDRYRYQSKLVRPAYWWSGALKVILKLLLSLDNDKWCRELETKAFYILSGRYSWDTVEVLYMFTWKQKNLNYDKPTGLKSRPIPVPSLAAIRNNCREIHDKVASKKEKNSQNREMCGSSVYFNHDRPVWKSIFLIRIFAYNWSLRVTINISIHYLRKRELACRLRFELNHNFFSRYRARVWVRAWAQKFFIRLRSIFSFNQTRFDFSLKSKYNVAKVNVEHFSSTFFN